MSELCALPFLQSLVKEPTSFKNVDKPSCIDHILTNHPKCFQYPNLYEK